MRYFEIYANRSFKSQGIQLLFLMLLMRAIPSTSIAQTATSARQPEVHAFVHNGYSRPYLVYNPAHLSADPPVVFMLGGVGSSAKSTAEEFGWMKEADRNNFLVVFPEPLPTQPEQAFDRHINPTFWEMQGSRSHLLSPGKLPVDDDGYLMAVLKDVLDRTHADRKRIYFAGFSSGSGMVQLFAARHSQFVAAIVGVATPLMEPPFKLVHPVSLLYIHGDEDEQFSGFEVNSPNFATTPHGNWVTWGYLNGCQLQRTRKTDWGVQFDWQSCKDQAQVRADFIRGLGHEWLGSTDSTWNEKHRPNDPLNFTDIAWNFFSSIQVK